MKSPVPVLTAVGMCCAGLLAVGAPANAMPASATYYVAPEVQIGAGDTSCSDAAFASIQTAVDSIPAGGTVVVCKGTYDTDVDITQTMSLIGEGSPVIDAAGAKNGYGIGIAADDVTVKGMTVENTPLGPHANGSTYPLGAGIMTAGELTPGNASTFQAGNDDSILDNVVKDNQGDGIGVESTVGTIVSGNTAIANQVAIDVSDDIGSEASHNQILGNTANDSFGGCGIVLADHSQAGIFDNLVEGNTADGNGTTSNGAGVFVGGYADNGGGAYNNTIESNRLAGNSNSGITMHVHVKGTAKWTGNKFIDNVIGTNNVGIKGSKAAPDYKDSATTGIYIGSAVTTSVVVSGNQISNDTNGIFTAGKVSLRKTGSNDYRKVKHHRTKISTYKG